MENNQHNFNQVRLLFFLTFLSHFSYAQPTISSIKINGQIRVLDKPELTLRALEDDLIFEFQPDKVDSFCFMMENFDAQTVKTAFPSIRYTHLLGGNYTFLYWTERNKNKSTIGKISLYVEEAMTETWWFYPTLVACTLILLGVFFYFWSIYDLRQKFKLETIRNRIASDLHDEIGSDLGSIVLALGTTQRTFGKNEVELSLKLEEIKEATRGTAANLRDTVWIIQPNNDALPQLLEKIRSFAVRILETVNVALVFDNKLLEKETFALSMEQRRCVYLMLREAVHNIAKHAQATEAHITAYREKEGIRIQVSDNGVGFDPSVKSSDGNGLTNFKTRAAHCFIDFDLQSTPSVGTTISMLIPEL
jgi:hypothetical protein